MATQCRIRVKGRLDAGWSDRMHGLRITTLIGDNVSETTLEGTLPDQAALQAVIASLGDLNLAVISVEARDHVEAVEATTESTVRKPALGAER